MAGYYDNKQDFGAARYYYAEVIKKYPDTELAKNSQSRMDEIKGSPERAPKPLGFLVDRLPESRDRARIAAIPEVANGGTRLAQAPLPTTGDTQTASQPTTVK